MGDVWFFGPIMIQDKWLLYALSFLISYIMVRLIISMKFLNRSILETLWNGFFLFIVVWKVSYTLFHPINVLNNPISQLYFTGGEKGVVFGLFVVFMYLRFKSKREEIFFHYYMDTAFIAGLTAISVYTLLVGVLYFPASYNYLFEALLAFVLLIYLVRSSQRSSQIWLKSLLWFCLGQLFLSYSQPQQAIFVSFSFSQLVYISLSIICIYFINYAQTSDKKDGITC